MQPMQPPTQPQPTQQPQWQPMTGAPPIRTSAQRKQEWRLILIVTLATVAGLAVLAQCALDIAIAGRLGN